MQVVPDASSRTLEGFLRANVAPGAQVVTDGWAPYRAATRRASFPHDRIPVNESHTRELLPGVHRATALLKRWLMGTHQGGVQDEHLQAYLDEYVFRFNRRHPAARGLLFFRLLQYAAGAPPVTYDQLVRIRVPKTITPTGVPGPRSKPGTLALPSLDRPRRAIRSPWPPASASALLPTPSQGRTLP